MAALDTTQALALVVAVVVALLQLAVPLRQPRLLVQVAQAQPHLFLAAALLMLAGAVAVL
jgi:hypothetical protein